MIGNISYDELSQIIELLNTSLLDVVNIVNNYKENTSISPIKIERFCTDLNKYIDYLKSTLEINKDADIALSKINELSNLKK